MGLDEAAQYAVQAAEEPCGEARGTSRQASEARLRRAATPHKSRVNERAIPRLFSREAGSRERQNGDMKYPEFCRNRRKAAQP